MITCVLLAAGLSQRFGSPKALAPINNKTAIENILDCQIQSKISEIIVVLGHQADQIKPRILKHKKVNVVHNKDYKFGQTSSFQTGCTAASIKTQGIMLWPVDFPFLTLQTINNLVEVFDKNLNKITIPVFHGRKGHPPIFPISLKNEILALEHTKGVNEIIHRHSLEVNYLNTDDEGVALTFNSLEELQQIKRLFKN